MRRITSFLFISACLWVFVMPIYADDCSEALNEAKSEYNAGNYSKAKELFDYVISECGADYEDAAAWAKKCADKLTPKLKVSNTNISVGASAGTTSITVTSNREWKLQNTSSNMFSVSKKANTVIVDYYANPYSVARSGYFELVTKDGLKSVRITVNQSPATHSNTGTTSISSSEATLSVSKSSISAQASGTTEYITVTCNQSWEIQYPSDEMYSVSRDGNRVIVKIYPNPSRNQRTDFFNIKTTDGKKVIKISLSQAGGYQSKKKSSNALSNNHLYGPYLNQHGMWELTWCSLRLGIGTGIAYSTSLMKVRWGPIQISPLEFAAGWDFIGGDAFISYQPTIDGLIPVNPWSAVYVGIGPTINMVDSYAWFKIETGWKYHWRNNFSSDFFLRYDGTLCIGASIQWSSEW
ncbi:MAG: hypothetical protein ACI4TV_02900 [Paludibacteraceae bacterium]